MNISYIERDISNLKKGVLRVRYNFPLSGKCQIS